jgi:hypothetical protein
MSLDMTVDTREAALDSAAEQIETEAAPAVPLWLQDLLVMTATAFGVLLSSALGVLLFLR